MIKELLLKEINQAVDNLKVLQDSSALHSKFEEMINSKEGKKLKFIVLDGNHRVRTWYHLLYFSFLIFLLL